MSSLKGFTYDNEKLDILLGYFEQGQISQEQAQDLQQLLEPLYRKALDTKNFDRARKISDILISLKGIISGRITLVKLVENVPISDRLDVKKIPHNTT